MTFISRYYLRIDRTGIGQSDLADRVFLLGIDNSESEDLKRYTGHKNYEQIGASLVSDCPEQSGSTLWIYRTSIRQSI
jgi:hypothetical protein